MKENTTMTGLKIEKDFIEN